MDERQQSGRPLAASGRDARVIAMVVLALLGAWISFHLTRYHLAGSGHGGSGVFHTVCEMTGGGCDQILKSTWSTLPRQIPTAFAGLIYFSAVALWYLAVGRPNRAGRPWFAPIFALQVFGVLFSLFLIAVMFEARALCGWCAFTHVLNFVLLGLAWTFWRAPDAPGVPAWPPARLGLAALLLVVLMGAFWERWLLTRYLFAEVEHFHHDTDLMRYLHIRNPQQTIPIRADDPARGA
ncbi:MAG TPA: vitamin K epoxide reductase family protein, partial [bacterium]|nr:vitamin K epoxide reductase family protein [bacterium]